jgi:predicted glycosyltransferase
MPGMSEWPAPRGPRVVIYVRDAHGVGQLRRAIATCRALRDRWPEATSLIIERRRPSATASGKTLLLYRERRRRLP